MVAPPEGVSGEGFFATSLNEVVGLARANSLWPLPLPPLVAELNSWQPLLRIMIWLVLVPSARLFRHV